MTGYHLCISNFYRRITIHAPTDKWQHLPREGSKSSYWVGPFGTEADAAGIAGDLAHQYDYERCFCKPCFPEKFPSPPTRGDQKRGHRKRMEHKKERTRWLPTDALKPRRG